ncbi:hypothetical protein CAAN1_19S00782 [[Candida] anglica]|uniref:Altered inheritance of mitochondria protein 18, mitochondrial n=1 Tax=[Candida] anglica TaxID=148631 RepID=A0ABP0E565_9ASCO
MFKRILSSQRVQGVRFMTTGSRRVSPRLTHFKIGAGIVGTGLAIYNTSILQSDANTSALAPERSISVDSSVDPFPVELTASSNPNVHTDYQLLGHGTRTVTFLRIKVYGIGLYLAQQDVPKVKKVLESVDNVSEVLDNSETAEVLVGQLLDDHVRFTARICPVRNTDFTHLKDGLIKSILSHPIAKDAKTRDQVGEGLEQLRSVFQGHKGSVPKNHLLWIEVLQNGSVSFTYQDTKTNTRKVLGQVENPSVGKILFLQYMASTQPLSDPLRKSCVQGYAQL